MGPPGYFISERPDQAGAKVKALQRAGIEHCHVRPAGARWRRCGRVAASRRSRSAVHEARQGAEYDVLDGPGQYAVAMLRAQGNASVHHVGSDDVGRANPFSKSKRVTAASACVGSIRID